MSDAWVLGIGYWVRWSLDTGLWSLDYNGLRDQGA